MTWRAGWTIRPPDNLTAPLAIRDYAGWPRPPILYISGLRVRKIVIIVVPKHTLHGKNVVHMTRGNDNLHFFYDVQNRPAVVVYNGTAYAYVRNLQGDIIAILDNTGTAVVSYTYDA